MKRAQRMVGSDPVQPCKPSEEFCFILDARGSIWEALRRNIV